MLRLAQWIDKFSDLTGRIFSWGMVILTLLLVWEVILRYVFNRPTLWAHETSGMLFLVLFMVGGSYALRHNAHVSVDVIYTRLSPRGRAIADVATAVFLILLCWVLVWYGGQGAWKSLVIQEHSSTTWSPPIYPVKIMVFVAAILLTLQAFAKLIHDVYMVTRGRETA